MRRRDVLWWALFGAAVSALLTMGIWVYLDGEPPHLLFAVIAACGVALSATFRIFRVRNIGLKNPRGDAER